MKKKIIKISIILALPLVFIGIMMWSILTFSMVHIGTVVSNINFNEDGTIDVIDEIDLLYQENSDNRIMVPLIIDKEVEKNEEEYNISYVDYEKLEVYCDGKELPLNIFGGISYKHLKDKYEIKTSHYSYPLAIELYNIPIGKHKIKIKYTYKSNDVIYQYNNATVLKLKNNMHKFSKIDYNITFPKDVNDLEDNSMLIKNNKISDNNYCLSMDKFIFKDYIELRFDKGIITQGRKINQDIEINKAMKLINNITKENFVPLIAITNITIIFFSIVIILTKKIRAKEYVRNPDMVLDPIISEAIIDRKIGAKELIMSCIVKLIYKKKLRNIGNDAVEIVNLDGISDYEKDIVDLVFDGKTNIRFNEIKDIFLKEDKQTVIFYNKFKDIKRKIEEKIYNNNIYSKSGDKLLKVIRIISWLLLLCVIYFMLTKIIYKGNITQNIQFIIILVGIMFLIKKSDLELKNPTNKSYRGKGNNIRMVVFGIMFFLLAIFSLLVQMKENLIIILWVGIIIVLDIIILRRTNLHVFTKRGKEEYTKAIGLKKYIIDYSLMDERELDSVIIWDEYLAYAVAFGISNKISRKFNENLMEANITIQRIDKILS